MKDFGQLGASRRLGSTQAVQWLILVGLTVPLVVALELARLPAAVLLGALSAGVVFSTHGGQVGVKRVLFLAAQSMIGCLIARSIGSGILGTMLARWPLLLTFVLAVIVFSVVLGGLLAYWKVLPGTTAIWGSSPGGASVMVIMSEAFGADIRLVAFMQYFRVAVVAVVASAVSRLWIPVESTHVVSVDWFPPVDLLSLLETVAIGLLGAWAGTAARIPSGALLVPMFTSIVLSGMHLVTITQPPWLMLACYGLIGWSIGLRFTRAVVRTASRAFTRVAASTLILVALCGGLGYLLHVYGNVDPLTAYLATSPGGADSVAIIAASSHVDLPLVMSLQTARFLVVMAIGPSLAKFVSRLVGAGDGLDDQTANECP